MACLLAVVLNKIPLLLLNESKTSAVFSICCVCVYGVCVCVVWGASIVRASPLLFTQFAVRLPMDGKKNFMCSFAAEKITQTSW